MERNMMALVAHRHGVFELPQNVEWQRCGVVKGQSKRARPDQKSRWSELRDPKSGNRGTRPWR
jgi:hypothetical protein